MLNNTTWLKLRRFILLLSILATVSAQNDAGINITTAYVGNENDLVHGYFNSHTAIAITVTLSGDNANGAGIYDLSNKLIKIRFGTRSDNSDFVITDFDLPMSTYSNKGFYKCISPGSCGEIELMGITGDVYDDNWVNDNDDVNSITFTITTNDVDNNAVGLNDDPTWVDFAIIFQNWNTNQDDTTPDDDSAWKRYNVVDWTDNDGNNPKTSLRWDTYKPYFWLWSWNGSPPDQWSNSLAGRYLCDVAEDCADHSWEVITYDEIDNDGDGIIDENDALNIANHILYYNNEIFKFNSNEIITAGTVSIQSKEHATTNVLNNDTQSYNLPEAYYDPSNDYHTMDLTGEFDLENDTYYVLTFTGTDVAGNSGRNVSYNLKFDVTAPAAEKYELSTVRITYGLEGPLDDRVLTVPDQEPDFFRTNYLASTNTTNNTMGITHNTVDGFEHYDDVESYAPGNNGNAQILYIVYQWSERMRDLDVADFYFTNEADNPILGITKDIRQEISDGKTVIKLIISDLDDQGVIILKIDPDNVTDYAGNPIDGTTDDGAEANEYEFKFIHDYTGPEIGVAAVGVSSGDDIVQSARHSGNDGVLEDINILFTWDDNISSDVINFNSGSISVTDDISWSASDFSANGNGIYTLTLSTGNMNVTAPGKTITIDIDGTSPTEVTDQAGNASTVDKSFSFLYDIFNPEINIVAEGSITGEIENGEIAYRYNNPDNEDITLTITITDIAPVDFQRGHITTSFSNIPSWTPQV